MPTAQLELPPGVASVTTIHGLVCDTVATPILIKATQAGKLRPETAVTDRFALDDIFRAYDPFGNAANHAAIEMALKAGSSCL
jgi:threonine dehydrogenase-like Zn-dependent dehydrogenase